MTDFMNSSPSNFFYHIIIFTIIIVFENCGRCKTYKQAPTIGDKYKKQQIILITQNQDQT